MSNWLNEQQKVSSQEGSEMEATVFQWRSRKSIDRSIIPETATDSADPKLLRVSSPSEVAAKANSDTICGFLVNSGRQHFRFQQSHRL